MSPRSRPALSPRLPLRYTASSLSLARWGGRAGDDVTLVCRPRRFGKTLTRFVLGLLVDLRDRYQTLSNRESGYGRYDVMLVPRTDGPAIVLEFKIVDPDEDEHTLEDAVASAIGQIEDKRYDAELVERGISPERIRHYGIAFEGKRCLVG